jgi:hypothetical protein
MVRTMLASAIARLLLAIDAAVLAVFWLKDAHWWSGPIVVGFTANHGLHENDWMALPVIILGAYALLTGARQTRALYRLTSRGGAASTTG